MAVVLWCRKHKQTSSDLVHILSTLQSSLIDLCITKDTAKSLNIKDKQTFDHPILSNTSIRVRNQPTLHKSYLLTALLHEFLNHPTLEEARIHYFTDSIIANNHSDSQKDLIDVSYRIMLEGRWKEAENMIHRLFFAFDLFQVHVDTKF